MFCYRFCESTKKMKISWNIPQMPKSRATFRIFLPIYPKNHYYKCILEIFEFFKKLISFCVCSCPEWIHKKCISVHWAPAKEYFLFSDCSFQRDIYILNNLLRLTLLAMGMLVWDGQPLIGGSALTHVL